MKKEKLALTLLFIIFAAFLAACSSASEPTELSAADSAPPTEAPPTDLPPTEASPTDLPPTEASPTDLPPTEAQPTEPPPTETAVPQLESADPQRGLDIFLNGGANEFYTADIACQKCHSLDGRVSADAQGGPSLLGVGSRAVERVPGIAADEYLRESILSPPTFLVPSYGNKMTRLGAKYLSEQEVEDVVAFLMTLTEGMVPDVAAPAGDPPPEIDLGMIVGEGNDIRGRIAASQRRCLGCHADQEVVGYAPPFASTADLPPILERGELRFADPTYEGQATTNQEYILESIFLPEAYLVPGDWPDVMPYNYHEYLTDEELANIMAWLATFE